jgi:general stress protein CsbA
MNSLKYKLPDSILGKLLWFAALLVIIVVAFQLVKVVPYILSIALLGASAYLLYDSCRKLKNINSDKR